MEKINIEIDGVKLEVEQGSMIIEAADAADIYIPVFATIKTCRLLPIVACV